MQWIIRQDIDLTDVEKAAANALWNVEWPPAPAEERDPDWQSRVVSYVMLWDEGALAAVCRWIERSIEVDGQSYSIAGLAGVLVNPAYRGRGLGKQLVLAAMEDARGRGYTWGVLFCGGHRRTFYEQFGWHLLEGEITQTKFRQSCPVDDGDLVMALPFTNEAQAQWPKWQHARIHVGVGQW
jgi:predicted N-acetyltransferase YhbS